MGVYGPHVCYTPQRYLTKQLRGAEGNCHYLDMHTHIYTYIQIYIYTYIYIVVQIKIGILPLRYETNRCHGIAPKHLVCKVYNLNVPEDECHCLFSFLHYIPLAKEV